MNCGNSGSSLSPVIMATHANIKTILLHSLKDISEALCAILTPHRHTQLHSVSVTIFSHSWLQDLLLKLFAKRFCREAFFLFIFPHSLLQAPFRPHSVPPGPVPYFFHSSLCRRCSNAVRSTHAGVTKFSAGFKTYAR